MRQVGPGPEDGDNMLIRNISWLSKDHTVAHLRTCALHYHRRAILKSYTDLTCSNSSKLVVGLVIRNIELWDIGVKIIYSKITQVWVRRSHNEVKVLEKKNSMVWVRERTIPTERPPLVGEVIANFLRIVGATWSAWRIPTAVFSVF
jgi:hypothetical protein